MPGKSLENETVSVVIATLNSRQLLESSIPAWLAQGVHEVVVVDGGSVDGSEEFILALNRSDPRVILVRELRPGLSVARNTGSRKASGKLLLHAGPDNKVSRGTLRSMLAELERSSLVSCRTRVSTSSWYRDLAINVSKARLSAGRDLSVVGTPYLGRRELFLSFPFDEHVQHSDDTFFCAHIRAAGHTIVRIPDYCLETGFDTVRDLKGRYKRWGHSDAEYFVRLPRETKFPQRVMSFTRAFWVEVFPPLKHTTVLRYVLAFPVLFVFGMWRFWGFLSSLQVVADGRPARAK